MSTLPGCKQARPEMLSTTSMDSADSEAKRALELAYSQVRETDQVAILVQKQAVMAAMAKSRRAYLEQQEAYKQRVIEERRQKMEGRRQYSALVDEESKERKRKEEKLAEELRRTAVERLRQQAQMEAAELAVQEEEKRLKTLTQARWMTAHMCTPARQNAEPRDTVRLLDHCVCVRHLSLRRRKQAEEERKAREKQAEIAAEREAAKAEAKATEEVRERQRAEWLAENRKQKREAWERQEAMKAAAKASREAEVKARFKASEAERIQREAERRLQERENAKTAREAHRRKAEEEQQKKKEARRAAAKALKQALAEATAAQYEQDERGRWDAAHAAQAGALSMPVQCARSCNARDARARAPRPCSCAALARCVADASSPDWIPSHCLPPLPHCLPPLPLGIRCDRLTKKLDPSKELMKKMRTLETEQQQMQADRDAELAAKEAAFQRAKREQVGGSGG